MDIVSPSKSSFSLRNNDSIVEHRRDFPNLLGRAKNTALYLYANSYICGVRVDSELQPKEDDNVFCINTEQNNYLVLESNVMGDYDRYADMLLTFAWGNGMAADKKDIFAVYNAKISFDNLSLKMYCPVKFDTK